jgi:hypothetical protein
VTSSPLPRRLLERAARVPARGLEYAKVAMGVASQK